MGLEFVGTNLSTCGMQDKSVSRERERAELETLRRFHDWPPRTKYSNSQTHRYARHTHTHYNTHTHTQGRRQRDMLRGPADNAQYVYAQFSGHSQNVVPNGECRGEYPIKRGSFKSG